MQKALYAVHDNVAQQQMGGIIIEPNDASACRKFTDLLAAKDGPCDNHQGDFDLWRLASLDTETMTIQNADTNRELILRGRDWLKATNPETVK